MNRELEMAKLACRALDEKKGKDIKVIDIHEVSVIADYFVIASAANQNQVQAMVDNVDETLGRAGFEAKQIEGTRNSSWVLMDYGDMIVHVFDEENRLFYDLERIWRDGKVLDGNEFLEKKVEKIVTVHSVNINMLAMHRLYANRIKSRGMSRVFCDLRSQKTPRGILPVNSNEKFTVIRCRTA